jgi:hypothetical protein
LFANSFLPIEHSHPWGNVILWTPAVTILLEALAEISDVFTFKDAFPSLRLQLPSPPAELTDQHEMV